MNLLEQLRAKRAAMRTELDGLITVENVEDYTAEADTRAGTLIAELAGLDTRIAELSELDTRETAAAATRAATGDTGTRETGPAQVTEPLTYTQESGNNFLSDAYRSQYLYDLRATERIQRHTREMETLASTEQRAVTTATMGGLIPPKYLLDMFAPMVYAGRPTANAVMSLPLPDDGMTLNIPRGTLGTSVTVQATENAALATQDITTATLSIPVITVGGQNDVSRQSLERGTGTDNIIFADLVSNYAVAVDTEVLNGSGTGGHALGILQTSGINTVAYTDGTPTLGELWPKIAYAVSQVQSNRYLPPTGMIMHPRRWAMMASALDTAGRPLINTTSPQNAIGVGDALSYGQVVGTIQGLPVITDANIPTNLGAGTNEDIIIVARLNDLLLWENGAVPKELRFEETLAGNLTVKLVVYNYMAFTAGRYPKSVCTIGGTGLVTPTF